MISNSQYCKKFLPRTSFLQVNTKVFALFRRPQNGRWSLHKTRFGLISQVAGKLIWTQTHPTKSRRWDMSIFLTCLESVDMYVALATGLSRTTTTSSQRQAHPGKGCLLREITFTTATIIRNISDQFHRRSWLKHVCGGFTVQNFTGRHGKAYLFTRTYVHAYGSDIVLCEEFLWFCWFLAGFAGSTSTWQLQRRGCS